jgi:acetyl-CoA acetyltransferase
MSGVVVVGAAESRQLGVVKDQSAMSLATSSALDALSQAGLTLADVDGVAAVMPVVEFAYALGVSPRWLDGTNVGGCSYMLHVRHAVAAIERGDASVVVIGHAESNRSQVGAQPLPFDRSSMQGQFDLPYGASGTFARLTLNAMAYLDAYGLGEADLAEVPVAQSRWANRNPRATRPELLTVEDVLASKMIAWPFRILECCPLNDGGGALVLTSAERARDLDLAYRPVTVAGSGEASEGGSAMFMENLTSFGAFRESSASAMRSAGVTHADIDHLMMYDSYAHLPLIGLEDLGFVGRGEAVNFIRGGATSPGGALPMNTNGGGLLYAHTGMYGMFALQEAVRQLQGCAAAQVEEVETSLVQGIGGMWGAAGAVVLQRG